MRIKVAEGKKFVLRVAGIFLHDGKVLLHRAEHEDIWALPGGGCEFLEGSAAALVRELNEELGATITVDALAFTAENFFKWGEDQVHEVGLYYYSRFWGESRTFYERPNFDGIEKNMEGFSDFHLHFKWFNISDIPTINIKPEFLKLKIQADSAQFSHVVNRS